MTAALVAGAAIGLSVAAPFGPVSLSCVQQSLDRGCRYGMASGFGAATSQSVFATVAIAGADTVSVALTSWSSAIRLVSALVLVWLGIRTILRARSVSTPARLVSMREAYASTLVMSLTNPMTIIPYLALATVQAEGTIGGSTLSLWSIPGVMMAAAGWYACLSFATGLVRRGISDGAVRLLNGIAGGSLIVFGAAVGRRVLSL